MERLHAWLVEHRPPERRPTSSTATSAWATPSTPPTAPLLAILDWELCTLGDPLADVSYLLRFWIPPEEPATGAVDPPTRAGGFGSRADVAARYAELSGRPLDDLDYWTAFNAWRSAAIGEGVYRRYIDGKMGELPEDVEKYARSVETTMAKGLQAAGLE